MMSGILYFVEMCIYFFYLYIYYLRYYLVIASIVRFNLPENWQYDAYFIYGDGKYMDTIDDTT